MPDLAERFPQNPILGPRDIAPSLPDLKIECLLNPGCFPIRSQNLAVAARRGTARAGAGKNDRANL